MSFLVSKRYFLSKNLTSRINSVFDYVDTLPSFMDGLAFDVGGEDMLFRLAPQPICRYLRPLS